MLAVIGYVVGHWVGVQISVDVKAQTGTDQNDVAILLGLLFGTLGWLIGLGFFNYPIKRMLGHPATLAEGEEPGAWRYFRLCTDHKVVGIQYLVAVLFFFFVGGLNAMLIRGELTSSNATFIPAGNYLTLVSLHGTMMLMMMSAGVLGPLGNYLIPLMIGARRMAFPRIEALTLWITALAGFVLLSAIVLGGFPTGWTGYQPLADQARGGMDAYLVSFALIGIALTLVGLNVIATVITMRAPGMTWNRVPIFVWGLLTTSILAVLAAPVLFAALLMAILDRTVDTSFFLATRRREPVPVGQPVLVLRPPRGVHPRAARLRDRARDPAGVRAQAAVGLPGRGRRHVRPGAAQLHGLAAPPVRQRYQREPAAVLHVHDRADLDPDRDHLPDRDGHAVARADSVHGADAVLACVLLQLLDRRPVWRLSLRRSERRDHAWQLLRDGPLPLHDHGRARVRADGQASTTGCRR